MTELQLFKFISHHEIEWHRWSDDKIYAFIPFHLIGDFSEFIGESILEEDGMEVVMKSTYICVEMSYICEYHEINPDNVFEPERA